MTMSTLDFLIRIEPLYQVQQISLVNSKIPTGLIARDRTNKYSGENRKIKNKIKNDIKNINKQKAIKYLNI